MIKKNYAEKCGYKQRARGFTLIELIVVIIVIGIMAAIALPEYQNVVEKSRKTEAYNTLRAILDAQRRYVEGRDTSAYDFTSGFNKLDINITSSRFFNFWNEAGSANPFSVPGEDIARADRFDGAYSIWINELGQFGEAPFGQPVTYPPVRIPVPPQT